MTPYLMPSKQMLRPRGEYKVTEYVLFKEMSQPQHACVHIITMLSYTNVVTAAVRIYIYIYFQKYFLQSYIHTIATNQNVLF